MTTRKHAAVLVALLALAALLGGCATPGVLHVYAVEPPAAANIRDTGQPATSDVPSFLESDEQLTGFAYDPFTDHFFLRLAPGNQIRVVDRPARAIKREFTVEGLTGAGDLAIRPRDGHVFFLQAGKASVLETTRLGKPVREIGLTGISDASAAQGIAYDAGANRLLLLHRDGRTISFHDMDGGQHGGLTLEREAAASLAFAAESQEIYAPLAGVTGASGSIGVFTVDGRLVRTIEAGRGACVDVGPRSFVRVF